MRILQAHNRHATHGGADDVLERDAALLRGAGHEVRQLLVEDAGSQAGSRIAQASAAVWNRTAVARLTELIETFRPEVLHVHTPFPLMSPAVFRVAHHRGVGTVGTVHSFRYVCIAGTLRRDGRICEDCVGRVVKTPGVRHGCYHDSLPASIALTTSLALHRGTLLRHVDRFLPLTEFAAGILQRDGIPADRVTVKPNCVDDPGRPSAPSQRGGGALFVGRLVEEKGVRTLLSAWQDPALDLTLTVLGDGPLRPLVEQAAAIDPRIDFRGWQSEETVRDLQARATVTIVSSEWYEAGPPLVLLQALAAGTPVVCSDLENICASAVRTGAASTFHTGDARSLSASVRALVADPGLLAARGAAARRLYEAEHTPEVALRSLESVYREVGALRSRG